MAISRMHELQGLEQALTTCTQGGVLIMLCGKWRSRALQLGSCCFLSSLLIMTSYGPSALGNMVMFWLGWQCSHREMQVYMLTS